MRLPDLRLHSDPWLGTLCSFIASRGKLPLTASVVGATPIVTLQREGALTLCVVGSCMLKTCYLIVEAGALADYETINANRHPRVCAGK